MKNILILSSVILLVSFFCIFQFNLKAKEKMPDIAYPLNSLGNSVNYVNNKYSFCELGDLVGDDVKRIKYHYYNIDYHSKEFKKTYILKLAKECLQDGVNSQYKMDCCMTQKMYPDKSK